jgi:hypothetical protein
MTSFLSKNLLFFNRVVPTLNSTFFKFSKSNLVVQRRKIYQKNLPKKILQDGGYFQNGVCTFFLYENMFSDRYFRSIVVIFGFSHYFLTLNHTKINFGFLDHPNMGLSYNILINKWLIHVILVQCQLVFWFLFWLVFLRFWSIIKYNRVFWSTLTWCSHMKICLNINLNFNLFITISPNRIGETNFSTFILKDKKKGKNSYYAKKIIWQHHVKVLQKSR